jgi:ketosteroid isomerase-like protein
VSLGDAFSVVFSDRSKANGVSRKGGEVMEPTTGRPDADAAEFLERCHDALRQHTGGNPRPYLGLWSHSEDVSLMGGVGGHQVGIAAVRELLTAAAKTLNYTTWSAETLVAYFGVSLGFTVELERLTRQIDNEMEEMSLRATSIYRREEGAWKVIHRHGDSLVTVEIDPEGRR